MKSKIIVIQILVLLIVGYYVLSFMLTDLNIEMIFNIMLLNFKEYQLLKIQELNIQHISLVICMFIVLFQQSLNIVSENISFSRMYIYKINRNSYLKMIILKYLKLISKLFCFAMISMFLFLLFLEVIVKIDVKLNMQIINIIIFFIKNLSLIFMLYYSYEVLSTITSIEYFILYAYIVYFIFLLVDFFSKSSFITYSDNILINIGYLSILLVTEIIIILIVNNLYKRNKEII